MKRAISKAALPFEVDCLLSDCSRIYVYTDGTEMKSLLKWVGRCLSQETACCPSMRTCVCIHRIYIKARHGGNTGP